jgi:tol-pal system protein YbgF
MKISIQTSFLSLALAAVLASPAAAADKEQRQMMADLRILQEQSQQLQNLIGALGTTLSEAVKAMNARLDEQANSNRKAFADQKLVIDTLSADLRVLREKVDDNNVRVGSLTQELEALRQTVAAMNVPRAASEPDINAPGGSPADPGAAPPAPAAGGAAAIGASPQKLFDSALADYWAGQYDLAVLGFDSYVKTFPQSPQADQAQLNIGNSYFNDAKYEKAIEAYDLFIRTYPKSNSLPDAYTRKGSALKFLKQNDKAREALEFVIKNYPDTTAATVAQQRLQEILAQKP